MGYLFGLIFICRTLGQTRNLRLAWRTDNISALMWVRKHMCSSSAAQVSMLAVSLLSLRFQFDLTHTSHLPGVDMGDVDALSRGRPHSLPVHLEVPMQHDTTVTELFLLCDPVSHHDLQDHLTVLERVNKIIDNIVLSV
jgi:hypothetical protein